MHSLEETERDKIEELMVWHGFTNLPLRDENKDKGVQGIFGEVIVTRTTALDAIFHGLNVLAVGNLLRVNPSICKFLFPTIEDAVVDITVMKSKFQLSPSAEKDTTEKINAFDWFFRVLDDCSKLTGYFCLSSVQAMHIRACRHTDTLGTFSMMFSKSTANFKPRSAVSGSLFAIVTKIGFA